MIRIRGTLAKRDSQLTLKVNVGPMRVTFSFSYAHIIYTHQKLAFIYIKQHDRKFCCPHYNSEDSMTR